MATYTPAALKADLASGPLSQSLASLVAARHDAAVATAYNLVDGSRTAIVAIPAVWLVQWAASSGVRRRIQAAASDLTNAAADDALAIQDYFWGGGDGRLFNLASPLVQAQLGRLAAAEVTIGGTTYPILNANSAATGQPPTPGSVADLMTWGTVPCSYAESAWSPPPSVDVAGNVARGTVVPVADVSAALNP